MKKISTIFLFAFLMMALSSCSVITGIFKAGVFVGVLAIVIVIAIVIWIFSLFMGGK